MVVPETCKPCTKTD